jgi:hypothetical protein
MSRTVKHISLHRIADPRLGEVIELRVVADVEEGVLALIQIEEAVIREYARQVSWPHRWVTLFVLEDLQPLMRQLRSGKNHANISLSSQPISSESASFLRERPVINVYDLVDLKTCNVFVNRSALVTQGDWDDPLALRGLLAHEHAHPLAENETTRSTRQVNLEIEGQENSKFRIVQVLSRLAEELCLSAPREVFTNELALRNNFSKALLHLNLKNVDSAFRNLDGRGILIGQLQQEVVKGNLASDTANLLLLVGDLNGYLPLALEVAPFYRAGHADEARRLEKALESEVFPRLDPLTAQAFTDLKGMYIDLKDDLKPPALIAWGNRVIAILAKVLAEKDPNLKVRLWVN